MYDFDKSFDRTGTGACKWEEIPEFRKDAACRPERLLPHTTADMEFRTAPGIRMAIANRAAHGIFGYTGPDERFYHAICRWLEKRHGQEVRREEIIITSSVIPALMAAIRAVTEIGDRVMFLSPAYTGFFTAIRETGRRMEEVLLRQEAGGWVIDYGAFEEKARKPGVKAFLLCNPHNPTGRVFGEEELGKLSEICLAHGIIVIADEIHGDLVLRGTHIMYRSLSRECRTHSITCMSPSKTFNLAGLQLAYTLIAEEGLREAFRRELARSGHGDAISAFGYSALIAAYEEGEEWLEELLSYLRGNASCLSSFLSGHCPGVSMSDLEGTYLAWLDFRSYPLSQEELLCRLWDKGLYLTDGRCFGAQGDGFLRMNLAVPRSELEQAARRLEHAAMRAL